VCWEYFVEWAGLGTGMKDVSAVTADLFYLTNRQRVWSAFVKVRAATPTGGTVKKVPN